MKQGVGNIAVEGKHITKDFRLGAETTRVLKDISLQVMQREFVSVMGPSGSGKSTLLYILGGLDTPTRGHVLLDGMDISRFGDEKMSRIRRQKIGFVFQFYNLIPNLNVEENIMLPLLLDGKKAGGYKKELDRILEVVGLSDRRRHTPRELSGGQQQRVFLARAMVRQPELLLLDEPATGVDPDAKIELYRMLRDINRELGVTIVMVSHDLELAAEVAHNALCLDHDVCFWGDVQQALVHRHKHGYFYR